MWRICRAVSGHAVTTGGAFREGDPPKVKMKLDPHPNLSASLLRMVFQFSMTCYGNLKTFHRSSWEFCKVTQKSIEKMLGAMTLWYGSPSVIQAAQAWHFMALPGDLLRSSPPTSFAGPYGVTNWNQVTRVHGHRVPHDIHGIHGAGRLHHWVPMMDEKGPGVVYVLGIVRTFDCFLLGVMTVWPWHCLDFSVNPPCSAATTGWMCEKCTIIPIGYPGYSDYSGAKLPNCQA